MKRLLVFGIVLCASFPVAAATVSGRVSFASKKGQNPVVTETLVWLEPVGGHLVRRQPATFQMTTRNKTLIPHVLAIPVGSTVTFPNDDPISHNLFSLSQASTFDLGLYRKGTGKSQKFDTPGIVNVYCNVHPNMSAVIHVMATTWYAFADANGAYSISDIPPGKYRAVAWNEQGGQTMMDINVTGSGVQGLALTLDTRNYRQNPHMNKVGKPYSAVPRDY